MQLEPSESDRLHADFLIDSEVQVIQLYAHVHNPIESKPGYGWTRTELITLEQMST